MKTKTTLIVALIAFLFKCDGAVTSKGVRIDTVRSGNSVARIASDIDRDNVTGEVDARITCYWTSPREDYYTSRRLASTSSITGMKLRQGFSVAADHRYYPPGTVINLPDGTERTVDDCGSGVKGRAHFDVYFVRKQDAIAWIRRYGNRAVVTYAIRGNRGFVEILKSPLVASRD